MLIKYKGIERWIWAGWYCAEEEDYRDCAFCLIFLKLLHIVLSSLEMLPKRNQKAILNYFLK